MPLLRPHLLKCVYRLLHILLLEQLLQLVYALLRIRHAPGIRKIHPESVLPYEGHRPSRRVFPRTAPGLVLYVYPLGSPYSLIILRDQIFKRAVKSLPPALQHVPAEFILRKASEMLLMPGVQLLIIRFPQQLVRPVQLQSDQTVHNLLQDSRVPAGIHRNRANQRLHHILPGGIPRFLAGPVKNKAVQAQLLSPSAQVLLRDKFRANSGQLPFIEVGTKRRPSINNVRIRKPPRHFPRDHHAKHLVPVELQLLAAPRKTILLRKGSPGKRLTHQILIYKVIADDVSHRNDRICLHIDNLCFKIINVRGQIFRPAFHVKAFVPVILPHGRLPLRILFCILYVIHIGGDVIFIQAVILIQPALTDKFPQLAHANSYKELLDSFHQFQDSL